MSRKLVQISADRLDALKLKKGILTDKELAKRLGVSPSHIFNIKHQGRCRQATAERLAKVIGWGFVEASTKGEYTRVEPYELPTMEGAQAEHLAHLMEQGKTVDELPPTPATPAEPPARTLEQTVLEFLARPIPERWPWYSVRERQVFWNASRTSPEAFAKVHRFPRDRVCAAEVWCEALGHPLDSMTRQNVKRINAIIAAAPGWEKAEKPLQYGPYGKCRGFVRVEHSTPNRRF